MCSSVLCAFSQNIPGFWRLASGPRLLAPTPLGGTHVQQSFRSRRNTCLGGTYVQQCFVCLFPQYLCAAFSCIFKSNSICPYMSYQNHAGLQPANLVTSSTVSCSHRKLLFGSVRFVFFSRHFFNSSRILSFFDRLRPNYCTDFLRQLRSVRDISEL